MNLRFLEWILESWDFMKIFVKDLEKSMDRVDFFKIREKRYLREGYLRLICSNFNLMGLFRWIYFDIRLLVRFKAKMCFFVK